MKSQLAIIIPAFKSDFLDSALKSLELQTCKEFHVYIGIDASPFDLESIIQKYEKTIPLTVKRFDDNLGGIDLVAHWERCISMTNGEPWLWLFSDDDIIGSKCVESFYKEIAGQQLYDIYHFDVNVIDGGGKNIEIPKKYPVVLESKDFYKAKCRGKIESFVVENIFSRSIYEKINGFVKFDLAWGSDTATWAAMANEKGIKTISGDLIYWRRSEKNITPNVNMAILQRKLNANIEMLDWANKFYGKPIEAFNHYAFFLMCFFYLGLLKKDYFISVLDNSVKKEIISKIEMIAFKMFFPFLRIVRRLV